MDEAFEGAPDQERLAEGQEPQFDEFSNPAGVSRGSCDAAQGAEEDPSCDLEVTAQVKDEVLEETKPGIGIPGYEGEEVGGG
jgi:hypothetical protein